MKETKKTKTQTPHCEFLEVLAFEMCRNGMYENTDRAIEAYRDQWQAELPLRKEWRGRAQALLSQFLNSGLTLKVSKSATLQKTLQFIVTQPEKVAYNPTDESA